MVEEAVQRVPPGTLLAQGVDGRRQIGVRQAVGKVQADDLVAAGQLITDAGLGQAQHRVGDPAVALVDRCGDVQDFHDEA